MSKLITTNKGKITKTLKTAITELKAKLGQGNRAIGEDYNKIYEGIKNGILGWAGKETFAIIAHSKYYHTGTLVIKVAIAEGGSLDPRRHEDNSITRMVRDICKKEGAHIHYYGVFEFNHLPRTHPYCWMITATWDV